MCVSFNAKANTGILIIVTAKPAASNNRLRRGIARASCGVSSSGTDMPITNLVFVKVSAWALTINVVNANTIEKQKSCILEILHKCYQCSTHSLFSY